MKASELIKLLEEHRDREVKVEVVSVSEEHFHAPVERLGVLEDGSILLKESEDFWDK